MLSRRSASEQQNRDVRAADHKQQSDGCEEQKQRPAEVLRVTIDNPAHVDAELFGEMRRSFFGKLSEKGL